MLPEPKRPSTTECRRAGECERDLRCCLREDVDDFLEECVLREDVADAPSQPSKKPMLATNWSCCGLRGWDEKGKTVRVQDADLRQSRGWGTDKRTFFDSSWSSVQQVDGSWGAVPCVCVCVPVWGCRGFSGLCIVC